MPGEGSFGSVTTSRVQRDALVAVDLKEFRLASGRPSDREHVFPDLDTNNWRNRQWAKPMATTGLSHATPYTPRHSCASLLIAEGDR